MCDDHPVSEQLGTLYGIGVGPGDPEMLTLKAFRVLKDAEVVFAPTGGKGGGSLARRIVEGLLEGQSANRFQELEFPMSSDPAVLRRHWCENARTVRDACRTHRTIVFLTLGDPSIYSTFAYLVEELSSLEPSLQVVTVPGISTMSLAAGRFNLPLLTGSQRLVLTPLPEELETLREVLHRFDTVVIYKIGSRLQELKELLAEEGLERGAYFASRVGRPEEKLSKGLDQVDGRRGYLSTVIVKTGEARA